MQPVIEPFEVVGSITGKSDSLEIYLQSDPMFVRVGQSTVHTLSMTMQAWNQVMGVLSYAECLYE